MWKDVDRQAGDTNSGRIILDYLPEWTTSRLSSDRVVLTLPIGVFCNVIQVQEVSLQEIGPNI